jgi:hypothetical protein
LTVRELGVDLAVNAGAEAICGRGDDLLIGIESVGTFPDGTRWAPIAHLVGDRAIVSKLLLTTPTGKISGMTCTFDGSTIHVLAIERHDSVSRILRFDLAEEITPAVELDLAPVLNDTLNLEGIARLPDGRLVMINDNQGAIVDGPTDLLVFHPR